MSWAARQLWGVTLSTGRQRPVLLGVAWSDYKQHPYPGEPSRALLFCTRKQASEWCAEKQALCNQDAWRYRPVRVIESVRISP